MRIAGALFLLGGFAYLAWDLGLTLSNGVRPGAGWMGLLAAALIFQGYGLFQRKKGARWAGFLTAALIACSSGYMASIFVIPGFPEALYAMPTSVFPIFAVLVGVSGAFAVAALLIVLSNRTP